MFARIFTGLFAFICIIHSSLPAQNFELWGTTAGGGQRNQGTIFKLGNNGISFTKVYDFVLKSRGYGSVMDMKLHTDGFLYGITNIYSHQDKYFVNPIIFRVKPDGSAFEVLHEFYDKNQNIFENYENFIITSDNYLVGRFAIPQFLGNTTVPKYFIYRLKTDGTDFQSIYEFPIDGQENSGYLLKEANKIYGVTTTQNNQGGYLYTLDLNSNNFEKIYTFTNNYYPNNTLIDGKDGFLYGTANHKEEATNPSYFYKIRKGGSDFTILHTFNLSIGNPRGKLQLGNDGNFYGIVNPDFNIIKSSFFRIDKTGTQISFLKQIPYLDPNLPFILSEDNNIAYFTRNDFNNNNSSLIQLEINTSIITEIAKKETDNFPNSSLDWKFMTKGLNNDLFVAYIREGFGGIAKVNLSNTNNYQIIHRFQAPQGIANPNGRLHSDNEGNLVGTTSYFDLSTIYKFNPVNNSITKLANTFSPNGKLLLQDENFYGINQPYGFYGIDGILFKLPNSGGNIETLYTEEANDYKMLMGEVVSNTDGYLYGLITNDLYAEEGTLGRAGKIFKIKPDGTDFQNVYYFQENEVLVQEDRGTLAFIKDDFIYGVFKNRLGGWIIFKVKTDGNSYQEIYKTSNYLESIDGLSLGSDGFIYVTTELGENNQFGSIFKLKTDGSNYQLLHNFSGLDGKSPKARLVEAPDGKFYGTTTKGGNLDKGVIYSIDKNGNFQVIHHFNGENGDFSISELLVVNAQSQNIVKGKVFEDLNGNCQQDSGEKGLANITIKVNNLETSTNAQGEYSISLPAGNYTLSQNLSASHPDIYELNLSCPNNPNTYTIDFQGVGETRENINFANQVKYYNRVSGKLFEDKNANCVQDEGELGLANTVIQVKETSITTTTNQNGEYNLRLKSGNYVLVPQTNRFLNNEVAEVLINCPSNGEQTINFPSHNEVKTAIDFGLQFKSFDEIKGKIFEDKNGNCVQDNDERSIVNAIVEIKSANLRAYTNQNGEYSFRLKPGTYEVSIHTDTLLNNETYEVATKCLNNSSIIINLEGKGEVKTDNNFALTFKYYDIVKGKVFRDRNNNCNPDNNESIWPNAIVEIKSLNLKTKTNAEGEYNFKLKAGDYSISVDPESLLYEDVYDPIISCPIDNQLNVSLLGKGEIKNDNNFGYSIKQFHIAKGKIYEDLNKNCKQDGEERNLANVLVEIKALNLKTFTNEKGEYSFKLKAGDYKITINADTLIKDEVFGTKLSCNQSIDITLLGDNYEKNNLNFAVNLIYYSKIVGKVFDDKNGNCVQDSGEKALENILIKNGLGSLRTVTNQNGEFSFRLPPNDYEIGPVLPPLNDMIYKIEILCLSNHLNTQYFSIKGDAPNQVFQANFAIKTTYFATVRGKVISSKDDNCTQNQNEWGMPNILIKTTDQKYAYTNKDGEYELKLPPQNTEISQSIEFLQSDQRFVEQICPRNPETYPISINGQVYTDTSGFNFVNKTENCYNLSVDAWYMSDFIRCYKNSIFVYYSNDGSKTSDETYIDVEFPDNIIPLKADLPWTKNGNVYTFKVGKIPANRIGYFTILDSVACQNNPLNLGLVQCLKARIYPNDICKPRDPRWSKANITVSAECVNANTPLTVFKIQNTGNGDMNEPVKYRLLANGKIILEDWVKKLNKGEFIRLQVPQSDAVLALHVEQVKYHPSNDKVAVVVQDCSSGVSGWIENYSFINQSYSYDLDSDFEVFCGKILGSYDPNDKLVSPVGFTDKHITPPNTPLEYTVRFQNTGTAPAFNVVILDTLSQHLDMNTFEVLSVSHSYELIILGDESPVLKWVFKDINLPDSTINEPASHGFVRYKILPKTDTPLGSEIKNFADIYFDYNDPIRTNTTLNTIDIYEFEIDDTFDKCSIKGFAPEKPIINIENNQLDSLRCDVEGTSYQWFLDGQAIEGNTQVIKASKSGNYEVIVSKQGCASPKSDKFNYLITDIDYQEWQANINLFPNPSQGHFTIEILNSINDKISVEIYNAQGLLIETYSQLDIFDNRLQKFIQTNQYANGLYLIKIRNQKFEVFKKLIINR
jgi:uncharacterized repeat protein (TIGR01451 family)